MVNKQDFNTKYRQTPSLFHSLIANSCGLDAYPIFDEAYRLALNQKIFNTYRFREYGGETALMFQHEMHTHMCDVMVLANQMYLSELLEFDPLLNYDVTETYEKQVDDERETSGNTNVDMQGDTQANAEQTNTSTSNLTGESNVDTIGNNVNMESDTPNEKLNYNSINTGIYASAASVGEDTSNNNTNTNTDSNSEDNNTSEQTAVSSTQSNADSRTEDNAHKLETFERTMKGNIGVQSSSDLLLKFRQTMLNIDKMVIDSLTPVFHGLF